MNRRTFLKAASVGGLVARGPATAVFGYSPQHASQEQAGGNSAGQKRQPTGKSPERILLKDYRPKSIYKIPVTEIAKARYPIIDMHSHPYAKTPEQIAEWVANMEEVGVEKTVILTSSVGREFDAIYRQYAKYSDRFEVWCGLDFTAYDQPGFGGAALRELERCYRAGARGVGELHDKGQGMASGKSKTQGLHPDDSRMDSMFEKCAELGLPISIHVADPIWMYQKMDRTNDGLMNAYHWRLLDYDLARLGELFDRNPNLYADISARYAETAPIPRFASQFYAKHSDRLLYGTDMGFDRPMYRVTFRILESLDEHFYETEQFDYHWSLNGFGLPDSTLQGVYHDNAAKIIASHPAKPR